MKRPERISWFLNWKASPPEAIKWHFFLRQDCASSNTWVAFFLLLTSPEDAKYMGWISIGGGVRLFLLLFGLCVCVLYIAGMYVHVCRYRGQRRYGGERLLLCCALPYSLEMEFLTEYRLESRKSEPYSCRCPRHADGIIKAPVFYTSFRIQTQILLPSQRALTHWASLQPFSLILNQKWPFSDCLLHHTSRPVRKDQPQSSR